MRLAEPNLVTKLAGGDTGAGLVGALCAVGALSQGSQ